MRKKEKNCEECGAPRSWLTEAPWGLIAGGICCKPCDEKIHEKEKQAAIAKAVSDGHDEHDCSYTDKIICPVCASVLSDDDIHEPTEMECDVCDAVFQLEIEYSRSFTTKIKENHNER